MVQRCEALDEALSLRDAVSAIRTALLRAGIESARAEAEILVEDAAGVTRMEMFSAPDRPLDGEVRRRLRAWVGARAGGVPVQYVTGAAHFYGRRFAVTPDVLIPRPETEVVVEHALRLWDAPLRSGHAAADVGTGSGAIAVTLAAERPERPVHATDISRPALRVARANAEALGAVHVRFHEGDLLAPLTGAGLTGALGLLVSNPPYIRSAEIATLPREVREHEPRVALDAGPDGLAFIRRLIAGAPGLLAPRGALVLEVAEDQGARVLEILHASSYYRVTELHEDLAGHPRVAVAERV